MAASWMRWTSVTSVCEPNAAPTTTSIASLSSTVASRIVVRDR
jgi:hypothetical protein